MPTGRTKSSRAKRHFIVRIESYEGRDTHLRCGDDDGEQDFLYCVVVVGNDGEAAIVDNGYRSHSEAAAAWPEAGEGTASRE